MKIASTWTLIGLGLLGATLCVAQQPPAGAPAGATALCKDGTYWLGAARRGACSKHKGVKEWYIPAGGSPAGTPAPARSPSSAPAPSAAAGRIASPEPARAQRRAPPAPSATAAPGGGPGLVWVNHASKVYHCSGDRWYGKTKSGEYMTEADARAKGYRPDHGRTCK